MTDFVRAGGKIAAATLGAALALGAAGVWAAEKKPAVKPPLPVLRGPLTEAPAATPDPTVMAKAECEGLFKGLTLEFKFLPPISKGQCGTAQPVELAAIGATPRMAVQPPAVLNCKMAAALVRWFDTSVQSQARALLKSPIVSITNAAAYDCRNRYNDPGQKLSEHAKANAIDISAFVTQSGMVVSVGDSWGPSLRDLIDTAKLLKVKPAGAADANGFAATVTVAGAVLDSGKVHKGSSANRQARTGEAAGLGVVQAKPVTPQGVFAHAVHASACLVFGTVLGPEANAAHNEHFHLDLTPRPSGAFCE